MSIATTRPSEVVALSQSSSRHERNHSQRKKESVTFCLLYKGAKNPVCGKLGSLQFLELWGGFNLFILVHSWVWHLPLRGAACRWINKGCKF
jgi:hypothetical protein